MTNLFKIILYYINTFFIVYVTSLQQIEPYCEALQKEDLGMGVIN